MPCLRSILKHWHLLPTTILYLQLATKPFHLFQIRSSLLGDSLGGEGSKPFPDLGVDCRISQGYYDQGEEKLDDGDHGGVHHLQHGGGEHLITLSK